MAFSISGSVQRKEIDQLLKYHYEKPDKISYHGSLQTIVSFQIGHNWRAPGRQLDYLTYY